MRTRLQNGLEAVGGWLAAFAGYYCLAHVGLHFGSFHGSVSPFWPAAGFAVAWVYLKGVKSLSAIFAAALLANYLAPMSIAAALGVAAGASAEAYLGALIFARVSRIGKLEPFSALLGWMAAAAGGAIVSACAGIAALHYFHGVSVSLYIALTWWLGDGIGIFIFAPVVLLVRDLAAGEFKLSLLLKLLAVAILCYLVCNLVFRHPNASAYLFFLLPLILAGALLGGESGAYVATLCIVTMSVFATGTSSAGPAVYSLNASVQELQPFLFGVGLTAHLFSSLIRSGVLLAPSIVLLGSWLLGGWAFHSLEANRLQMERIRFESAINTEENAIRQRLRSYADALRAGASLFVASSSVTREEWRKYVASLDIEERYPGVTGFGVIFRVDNKDLPRFVSSVREDGAPYFRVRDIPGSRAEENAGDESLVVTYAEPLAQNISALGLNIRHEPIRASAAYQARDTGACIISGRIDLIQEESSDAGFLLLAPIYQSDRPARTVNERRETLSGWVYAVFLGRNFIHSAVSPLGDRVKLWLFHGTEARPENLVYGDKIPPRFAAITRFNLHGQEFTAGWMRGSHFESAVEHPFVSAGLLALVPILLAGLSMSLQLTSIRANQIASERTRELRDVAKTLEEQIAERRTAERLADEARATAVAANVAKSEFLATMSHEIRTPLNGVLGFADLLANADLPGEQREWAQNIAQSGRSLLVLLNDILDFSKIEAGKLELEEVPFSPRQCGEDVISLLTSMAQSKGIELQGNFSETLPSHVRGDPTRYRQILTNLCSNSVKFTERGKITMLIEWDNGVLRSEVADTGIGIPKEKQSLLFTKFTQIDRSTTRRFGGTGLGLAICKSLVDLMGGRVFVDSEVGRGTTITFEIPAPAVSLPAGEGPAVPVAVAQTAARILLAEDAKVNQKLASAVLRKLGCTVDVAVNGSEAVEKAIQNRYDLIFMDCQMPELDGFAATRMIRRQGLTLPIIAVTANAFAEDRASCLAAGMNDFLSKPYSPESLASMVHKWAPGAGDA